MPGYYNNQIPVTEKTRFPVIIIIESRLLGARLDLVAWCQRMDVSAGRALFGYSFRLVAGYTHTHSYTHQNIYIQVCMNVNIYMQVCMYGVYVCVERKIRLKTCCAAFQVGKDRYGLSILHLAPQFV